MTPASGQAAGVDETRITAAGTRSSSAPNALSLGFQPPAGRRRLAGADQKGAFGSRLGAPSTRDSANPGLPPLLPQPPASRLGPGAASGRRADSPVPREQEQRDEVRALFQRGVEERRMRQRLAAVDAALEALRAAAPGDDVGLHESLRQLSGGGSRASERDTVVGGDGVGTVVSSHFTSATRASSGSTASAVLRRITARDILAEVKRAARHLRSSRAEARLHTGDNRGGSADAVGESDPGDSSWGALELAPRAAVLALLAQLHAAGASHEALSGIMEASVPAAFADRGD